jgi:uncharacterized protein (TIGR02147 family)
MSVFMHTDYKAYLRERVRALPKKGYGEHRRIARHLGVSSTMISQVFTGQKDLSLELACELSEYLGHGESEERYFLLLVELARAGSKKLQEKFAKLVREQQENAQKISEHVRKDRELSGEDKAIYYSSWIYTATRNLTAIPNAWSMAKIAVHLQVPEPVVREVVEFLLARGLLQSKDGTYEPTINATHLGAESPLVVKHHQNWRLRGMMKMDLKSPQNTFYTGPLSLSRTDVERVRQILVDAIATINKLVVASDSETARCLNIDWFEF